jgi:hypothetical protein
MQRSLLAFAIATAIVVTAVPVSAGQRATGAARSSAARRAPVKAVPSPVQKELQRNLVLADGLRGRLHGTDPIAAAAGFRRLELFVATAHASNTLAIPFFELKRRIVGDGMTLGQAIQDIRPTSHYWTEARRAEDDAAEAIRMSEAIVLASERKPPSTR